MTTVGEIIGQAKVRADMERSKFVSAAAWLMFYNAAYSELYDLLVGSYQKYFLKPSVITVSGGTGVASLPTDFYKFVGIDSDITKKPLRSFDFGDRWEILDEVRYCDRSSDILFLPAEKANGTYTLWYVPTPAVSTSINDNVLGAMGWEEFIVLSMAVKALNKEESFESADRLKLEKAEMERRIVSLAPQRNSNKRRIIRDVRDS